MRADLESAPTKKPSPATTPLTMSGGPTTATSGPAASALRLQRALGNSRAQSRPADADAGHGLTAAEIALLASLPLAPVFPAVLLPLLTPALLRGFLERLPVEMVARAVGQLPVPLIGPMLGPVVIHLDPFRTREVVRGLGRDNLRELIAAPETRASLEAAMRMLLDRFWPVGVGFSLDAAVGFTFGIPIHAGMSYMMYLWHSSNGVFKFMRRVEGRLAADFGVGAGAYFGGKGKPGGEGGSGAGAAIGGNAELGVKLAMLQDFEFRVFEDAAFLSLLLAVGGSDLGRVESVGIGLLESIHGLKLDPMHFNTRTRVDAALYAQLAAEASAGVRAAPTPAAGTGAAGGGAAGGASGGAGTGAGPAGPPAGRLTAAGDRWKQATQGAPDLGSQHKTDWWRIVTGGGLKWTDLLAHLNASLGGRLFGQFGVAVEMRPRNAPGTPARARVGTLDAQQLEVDVMAEASAAADLVARIPVLGGIFPQVGIEQGGGIKLSYVLTRGVPLDRAVRLEGYSVYHKRGELDYYAGVAEETELKFVAGPNEGYLPDLPSGLDELLGKVGELRVRRRVPLGMFRGIANDLLRGRDYRTAERRQQGARALLKEKYKAWGITSEGFVTLTLVLGREELERVLRLLRETVAEVTGGPTPWRDLLYDVWRLLATGKAPLYVRKAAGEIAGLIRVTELVFHEQMGVVGAAGAALGAGAAKVRAHGRGAAVGFYDSDNLVEDAPLTAAQALQIARALLSAVL